MNLLKILDKSCRLKLKNSGFQIVIVSLLLLTVIPFIQGCNEPVMVAPELSAAQLSPSQDNNIQESFQERTLRFSPLRATGDGSIEFLDQNGKKSREGLTKVDIFLAPQGQMYVNFDHLLQSKAIRMGTTGEEFWCWIRFAELNDYYWGNQRLVDQACVMPYGLRPEIIYEAFGLIDFASLKDRVIIDDVDGLKRVTVNNPAGRPVKRYYITPDSYLVTKIEYFGQFENPFLIANMSKFRSFNEYGGYAFPGKITLIAQDGSMDMTVNVKNLRALNLEPAKQQKLFSRQKPLNAKKIYRMNSYCEFELQ